MPLLVNNRDKPLDNVTCPSLKMRNRDFRLTFHVSSSCTAIPRPQISSPVHTAHSHIRLEFGNSHSKPIKIKSNLSKDYRGLSGGSLGRISSPTQIVY